MTSKKDYTKDIIEEYNILLQSWGNSDTWGLNEFKMLEDLIYEASKMRINANTLKRFFQQRTSNPQVATYNALCIFLGYASYAEFVIRKTRQEKIKPEDTEKPAEEFLGSENEVSDTGNRKLQSKRRSEFHPYKKSIYTVIIIIIVVVLPFVIINYWDDIKKERENHLLEIIIFESAETKGASPFTLKVKYEIPEKLLDSISLVCIEANGDVTTRKIHNRSGELYATFIYSGRGFCRLMYKNKIIKNINVESRTRGWSAYLMEDRTLFYHVFPYKSVSIENGYLTLPLEEIPEKAVTDQLFVSYDYFNDSIIDGDNFIFEARVRNSVTEDHAIPCNDIMMYIFSDTGLHGFALNENCYSYLKFISSENTITGNQQDLSWLKFNPNIWHVMRIKVIDKQTTFYLDDHVVSQMSYKVSLGPANELTLRFKGCGAVDYVKVIDPKTDEIVFQEHFTPSTQ